MIAAPLPWVTVLAVLAIPALLGCSPPAYDHMELEPAGAGSAAGQLSPLSITLTEGAVMEVTAVPMSSSGPLGGGFTFDLTSSDTTVLGVEPALGEPSGPADFVFFGVGPGDAEIRVTINGEPEASIPATVTAQ
jgi:hypothetical protein